MIVFNHYVSALLIQRMAFCNSRRLVQINNTGAESDLEFKDLIYLHNVGIT